MVQQGGSDRTSFKVGPEHLTGVRLLPYEGKSTCIQSFDRCYRSLAEKEITNRYGSGGGSSHREK